MFSHLTGLLEQINRSKRKRIEEIRRGRRMRGERGKGNLTKQRGRKPQEFEIKMLLKRKIGKKEEGVKQHTDRIG